MSDRPSPPGADGTSSSETETSTSARSESTRPRRTRRSAPPRTEAREDAVEPSVAAPPNAPAAATTVAVVEAAAPAVEPPSDHDGVPTRTRRRPRRRASELPPADALPSTDAPATEVKPDVTVTATVAKGSLAADARIPEDARDHAPTVPTPTRRRAADPTNDDRVTTVEAFSASRAEREGDEKSDATEDEDRRFLEGPRPAIYTRAFPPEHVDEDAAKVIRRLRRQGFAAYLVGGGVRDLLLGRKPKDFDVATSARPHEVKQIFRNCRVIGRRFRLAHILFGQGKVIETATFRRDPSGTGSADDFLTVPSRDDDDAEETTERTESDARRTDTIAPRPKARDDDADLLIRHDNVFGEPHEDAVRRDFTINGLFYDIERQEVIDYVGGMHDLEARVVNTIGLPDVRFREDPVRMLRAIKFSARLDLGIDPECYDAIVALRDELRKAAKARLFEEILRLMRGGASHRSLHLLWETGCLSILLPSLAALLDDGSPRIAYLFHRLDEIDERVADGHVPSDTVLLAALLEGVIEEAVDGAQNPVEAYDDFAAELTETLALPRRIKDRMRIVLGCQRRLQQGRLGTMPQREFFADAVELYEIDCVSRGQTPAPLRDAVSHGAADLPPRRRRRRRRPFP